VRKPQEIASQTTLAAAVVFGEIWPIIVRHKKTVFVIFIFEIWVHGLVFRYISDLKSLKELFPFVGALFGS